MIRWFKRLWSAAPLATVLLVLALAAAGLFAVRSVAFVIYWSDPARQEQTIAGWMTPGYIAHSWQVPRAVVLEAVNAPVPPPAGPMSLRDLAALNEVSVDALIAEVEAAIAAHRAGDPGDE
ncbi:hypothetical protein [Sinisalibacter lacisalsi]|uniref:Uncharacterized protein n=1 Tax=Sinisalibacter lacisalsi TaxID=1526570 RepID=A0ABQ1QPS8_9RHOB|nr:hypothetical protein [Sinisalibacter lacisalsi]GGD34282.1 hypothetical protein GCM10011358_17940 [Sinisalibacter lacisalsi]